MNSARYRKQALTEQNSQTVLRPLLLTYIASNTKSKAEMEAEERNPCQSKGMILYSKGNGRKPKPKKQEKRQRVKRPQKQE